MRARSGDSRVRQLTVGCDVSIPCIIVQSLNVMQACHMAYDEINENNVYACTGNPLPSDMKLMLNILNNDPMKQAFEGHTPKRDVDT
jgi:hypothetical protein